MRKSWAGFLFGYTNEKRVNRVVRAAVNREKAWRSHPNYQGRKTHVIGGPRIEAADGRIDTAERKLQAAISDATAPEYTRAYAELVRRGIWRQPASGNVLWQR